MGSWFQGKSPFSFKELNKSLGKREEENRKRGGKMSDNNEIKGEGGKSGLLNHALSLPGNHCAA